MANGKETTERVTAQRVRDLRAYLRDDPLLNELLEGKESTDGQLREAILDSIDDWNNTQPPLAFITVENHPSRRMLIRGAAIEILRSTAIYYARNQLPYSDGGISVDDKNKLGPYLSLIQDKANDYETKKINLKKSLNISLGFGQIPSEYSGSNTGDETLT